MHCLGPDLTTELSSGGVLGVCDVQTPSQSWIVGAVQCVMCCLGPDTMPEFSSGCVLDRWDC